MRALSDAFLFALVRIPLLVVAGGLTLIAVCLGAVSLGFAALSDAMLNADDMVDELFMTERPDPEQALAEARSRVAARAADDEAIWWQTVAGGVSTHILRRDGSWAMYRTVGEQGDVEQTASGRGDDA